MRVYRLLRVSAACLALHLLGDETASGDSWVITSTDVLAETSGTLSSIDELVAVSGDGAVAYVGQSLSGSQIYVVPPGTDIAVPRAIASPSRTYRGVAISSGAPAGQGIAATDRTLVGKDLLWKSRLWAASGPITNTIVGESPFDYETISQHHDIDDAGGTLWITTESPAATRIVHRAASGAETVVQEYAGIQSLRPELSNVGTCVVRDPLERVVVFPTSGGLGSLIASVGSGLSAIGSAPGISPDGNAIAYVGTTISGSVPVCSLAVRVGSSWRSVLAAAPSIGIVPSVSSRRVSVTHQALPSGRRLIRMALAADEGQGLAVYLLSMWIDFDLSGDPSVGGVQHERLFGVGDTIGGDSISSVWLHHGLVVGPSTEPSGCVNEGAQGAIAVVAGHAQLSGGGAAVVRVRLEEQAPSELLFREEGESSWVSGSDEIPGFDHVGLLVDGKVYESHPGYQLSDYWDPDQERLVCVEQSDGYLTQHTRGSFMWDATSMTESPVSDSAFVRFDVSDARALRAEMERDPGAKFLRLPSPMTKEAYVSEMTPDKQKGDGGAYTCVGLIEKAAELANVPGPEGFVPDVWEEVYSFGLGTMVPLLSPELMLRSAQGLLPSAEPDESLVLKLLRWIDRPGSGGDSGAPGEVSIVDSMGRRAGVIYGERFEEIPGAFASSAGVLQTVMVPWVEGGSYLVSLRGNGSGVGLLGVGLSDIVFEGVVASGDSLTWTFEAPVTSVESRAPPGGFQFSVAPSPFRRATSLECYLASPARWEMRIVDVQGRTVRSWASSGHGCGVVRTVWDGRDGRGRTVSAGVYWVHLRVGAWQESRKLVRLR